MWSIGSHRQKSSAWYRDAEIPCGEASVMRWVGQPMIKGVRMDFHHSSSSAVSGIFRHANHPNWMLLPSWEVPSVGQFILHNFWFLGGHMQTWHRMMQLGEGISHLLCFPVFLHPWWFVFSLGQQKILQQWTLCQTKSLLGHKMWILTVWRWSLYL